MSGGREFLSCVADNAGEGVDSPKAARPKRRKIERIARRPIERLLIASEPSKRSPRHLYGEKKRRSGAVQGRRVQEFLPPIAAAAAAWAAVRTVAAAAEIAAAAAIAAVADAEIP